ncbi:NADH-quinone oxidoreductase subunit NuoE, partial [Streptomyces cellulosae]
AGPASLIGLKLAKGEAAPARVVHPRGGGAPAPPPPPPAAPPPPQPRTTRTRVPDLRSAVRPVRDFP